jgi:hypothetical protein
VSTPIGSVWASGSWSNTAWAANTWANTTPTPPSPNTFRVGGGGNYDPFYWDKIRRKREEEEIVVVIQ